MSIERIGSEDVVFPLFMQVLGAFFAFPQIAVNLLHQVPKVGRKLGETGAAGQVAWDSAFRLVEPVTVDITLK